VRYFGRSVAWASLAFVAMLGAFVSARSENGLRRINEALNQVTGQTMFANTSPRATEPAATKPDPEALRLAGVVQTLTADRDRVLARLAALERSVDVTGSLPPRQERPTSASPTADSTGPVVASVTLIPPNAGSLADAFAGSGMSGPGALPASGSAVSPRLPERMSGAHSAADSVVTHTQFGIDLGSEADIEALRALWVTLRARHVALLEGLQPIVAARDTDRRGVVALHLVVGPLDNAAAAARLCAALGANGRTCRPSTFDGQRLALR
jgi:hypothetical protein